MKNFNGFGKICLAVHSCVFAALLSGCYVPQKKQISYADLTSIVFDAMNKKPAPSNDVFSANAVRVAEINEQALESRFRVWCENILGDDAHVSSDYQLLSQLRALKGGEFAWPRYSRGLACFRANGRLSGAFAIFSDGKDRIVATYDFSRRGLIAEAFRVVDPDSDDHRKLTQYRRDFCARHGNQYLKPDQVQELMGALEPGVPKAAPRSAKPVVGEAKPDIVPVWRDISNCV